MIFFLGGGGEIMDKIFQKVPYRFLEKIGVKKLPE